MGLKTGRRGDLETARAAGGGRRATAQAPWSPALRRSVRRTQPTLPHPRELARPPTGGAPARSQSAGPEGNRPPGAGPSSQSVAPRRSLRINDFPPIRSLRIMERMFLLPFPRLRPGKRKFLLALPRLPGAKRKFPKTFPRLPGAKRKFPKAFPRLPGAERKFPMPFPRLPGAKRKFPKAFPRLPGAKRKFPKPFPRLPGAKRKFPKPFPRLPGAKRKFLFSVRRRPLRHMEWSSGRPTGSIWVAPFSAAIRPLGLPSRSVFEARSVIRPPPRFIFIRHSAAIRLTALCKVREGRAVVCMDASSRHRQPG